jgi:hypothetical protein
MDRWRAFQIGLLNETGCFGIGKRLFPTTKEEP